MTVEFRVPQYSHRGSEPARVGRVLVQEGETLRPPQAVFELDCGGSSFELTCPHEGRVVRVHVATGEAVDPDTLLLTLDEVPPTVPLCSVWAPLRREDQAVLDRSSVVPAIAEGRGPPSMCDTPTIATVVTAEGSAPASPFSVVGGSRPRTRGEPPMPMAQRGLAEPGRHAGPTMVPVLGASERIDIPVLPDFSIWGPVERQPISEFRRRAAAQSEVSWGNVPQGTVHELASLSQVEEVRRRLESSGPSGTTSTVALVIKATAAVLARFGQFNASYDPAAAEIVLKRYCHIGVAIEISEGLVIPVLHDADKKEIQEIATELADLTDRARRQALAPAELLGASFTVVALSELSGIGFTPAVRHPQVASLGILRPRWMAAVDPPPASDARPDQLPQPQARLFVPLSLSFDRRILTAAEASRFLSELSHLLADPASLLAEAQCKP